MVAIGKKRLPDPAKHERFFGFVEATDKKVNMHHLSKRVVLHENKGSISLCGRLGDSLRMESHVHTVRLFSSVISFHRWTAEVKLLPALQMEGLTAALGPRENQTKTRGVRRTEAARALGEGKQDFGELVTCNFSIQH
jgi:hypothetical protein